MILDEQNVLFFSRSTEHGGTENVILQLCEILNPLVNKIVVVTAKGFATEKLKPYGIKHYIIPDIETKTPKIIVKVCKDIKRIVNKEEITVIHTHHRMAAFYVRLLCLDRKCTFINTSHNTFNNKRFLTRFAYKNCHLIACGEMVKRNLHEIYGIRNVTVIHNAVKPFNGDVAFDRELLRDKLQGMYLVGNIGRLSKQKGMEYFIRAVPIVIEKHPRTKFYIIGSGDDAERLKEMSKGLPITFLGYRNDIQNIMSQLDLIVLSSLWEGFPLTPIEAFSVGKTIIATGVDGTLEIVKDGENGLIVPVRNERKLADGINWMIEHPNNKEQMEKRAEEDYKAEFSFYSLAKAYTDYYRSI